MKIHQKSSKIIKKENPTKPAHNLKNFPDNIENHQETLRDSQKYLKDPSTKTQKLLARTTTTAGPNTAIRWMPNQALKKFQYMKTPTQLHSTNIKIPEGRKQFAQAM